MSDKNGALVHAYAEIDRLKDELAATKAAMRTALDALSDAISILVKAAGREETK